MRHPLAATCIATIAAVAAIATWTADWRVGALCAAVASSIVARRDPLPARVVVLLLAIGLVGGLRAARAWDDLTPARVGPYQGWVRVVDEPQPYGSATRVIVDVDGQHFETWARGRARRLRVAEWRAGEHLHVAGELRELKSERRQRVAWQHVVGELRLDWVSDVRAGSPLDTASNRVRATIERAAATLPGADGALYRGLVIGDDRDQPIEMIERFRASGLSHLTAVSGQNVAFVLAAAGPLLRGLRPALRWVVTLGLIGWFVSLTRFEPSIVRAGTMAVISATAFAFGRERSPARLLWLAVTALLLIDPLLVRSVGFQLSVGATAGVAILGTPIAAHLGPLGPLRAPVGFTLGAQLGVAIPQLLVFGRLPLVSVPANLLAVPVAGGVMLYGLPAGLLAGAFPAVAPVLMFPCRLGVRWVDTVAMLAEHLEPGGAATWWGWAIVAALIAWIARPRSEHV